ncbi:MAG: recombinase family protein [Caulobacteraceae bacterium]
MKFAIYSRKSKFTGIGESIENQITMCREYIEKNFKVDEAFVYEDEGFSGGNVDRPKFQKMLKDAKANMFDAIVCYRLDRISRNISDFSNLINSLQEYNISFISIREQFDTSTPLGRAMMYIASVFAQLERETIAERIRDNMLQLARAGRWTGGKTPTGFKSEPVPYYDNEMNEKKMYKLTGIPGELELVRNLYNQYLRLGSISKLEIWCAENGVKSKNGNYFDKSALKMILSNPVYAVADELLYDYFSRNNVDIASDKKEFNGSHGVLSYNKTQEVKGKRNRVKNMTEWIVAISKHKGIIPSSDWIRVQNIIEQNKDKAPRYETSKIGLLSGLIRCNCGALMRLGYGSKRTKPERNYYYICTTKERSHGVRCANKNVVGKDADKFVKDELMKLSLGTGEFSDALNQNKSKTAKQDKIHSKKLQTFNKELEENEKAIENLTLQLSQNSNSTAAKYIISQIEKLDQKTSELKYSIERLKGERERNHIEQMNIDLVNQAIKNFPEVFDKLGINEKRKYIKNILSKITWDGNAIHISIHGA